MKFVNVSNKILQYSLFLIALLSVMYFPVLTIFVIYLPASTATIPTFVVATLYAEKGLDVAFLISAIFFVFLLFMGSFAIKKNNSLLAFVCFVFFVCDTVFAIMRIRTFWLEQDIFNDKILCSAIANPVVLALFVIYFIGLFREKRAAKLQAAKTESLSE